MKKDILTRLFLPVIAIVLTTVACGNRKVNTGKALSEDLTAKKMLQGVWLDEDEEDPAFRVIGDTIFYPDSTSQPVYFQIVKDTLILHGSNMVKYQILKQAPHFFMFKNQNGDL